MPRLRYKNNTEWVEGVDIFYPVGAIYMSTNETSPADLFGGTWSSLTDGRFLRPMGSYNQLGGTTEHSHYTGTGYYSPEKRLDITYVEGDGYDRRVVSTGTYMSIYGDNCHHNGKGQHTQDMTYPTSTLPVYRTVYCWIRTA